MTDFDADTAFTHNVLDALAMRTKATLHNIANQGVPGFKRYAVQFEQLLRDAVDSGRDERTVTARVERDTSGPDGQNNVVLMDELALLGKASLVHDLMTRRAGAYFSAINKAIFGR